MDLFPITTGSGNYPLSTGLADVYRDPTVECRAIVLITIEVIFSIVRIRMIQSVRAVRTAAIRKRTNPLAYRRKEATVRTSNPKSSTWIASTNT